MEEIFMQQKFFLNEKNKKQFKFFFLNELELKIRLDNFTQKTLKNIKIIEYDTLHELNLRLLSIPIIFKESFSNLGMVIIDSPNMLECDDAVKITDEKSIYNSNFLKNDNQKKNKPGKASEILTNIYFIIHSYQKDLGFNLINLILDYERESLCVKINYNRIKYDKNFHIFEANNNLNVKFRYVNKYEYILYKIPNKPLIGMQFIPVELLMSSDEESGIFAIAFMEECMKMTVNIYNLKKNCDIEHLMKFNENLVVKI